ncbi:xylulokinase [Hoeflea prorocentri]|uniref:Xylulose kinase n=1 Tax=Hoeflea prorocentri TaxID=1922333 RepID=A0A9X3UIY9_9HYPH|nr:xylulokinase [Hoeflea prorocentri]MCY6381290.1 xylulokinase [Hoeflea prorocentri]MDA5399090.1 xylulokinase [Hoeflea prorocentri]
MYLGIDLGTSGVKTLIIDDKQQIVASATADLKVSRPSAGWSEQDPADWIEATRSAVGKLKVTSPVSLAEVSAIGLSGQMHGATLIDADDGVLRPCMLWNDTRAHAEAAQLDADPKFRAISGNIVFPGFTAPKLLWVKNNEPDIFSKIAKVLLPKDYLRLWLTGEHISEMSDASGTSWLDVGNRRWSAELLAASSMDADQMPRLVEGSQAGGALRLEIAMEWGMRPGTVVAGGAGDNAATAMGMGTIADGSAFVSLGTSGVIFAANDVYRPEPESAVHAFCHALPDRWHQMGVILSATDSLNWFAALVGKSAASLTQELGETLREPQGLFLPYLSGERTPHNDAAIRGILTGVSLDTDTAAITASILQGVAFAFRDSLEALQATGTGIERLVASGGGSRSDYWLRTIATALNVPIDVPAAGDVGAAFGAARLAMLAAGRASLASCTPPPVDRSIEPVTLMRQAYEDAYQQYRETYPAIRSTIR